MSTFWRQLLVQPRTIADFWLNRTPENFERFGLGRVTEQRVPGLTAVERYSKLIVLGKPGRERLLFEALGD
jgi:hypothetical protein